MLAKGVDNPNLLDYLGNSIEYKMWLPERGRGEHVMEHISFTVVN